MDSSKNGKIQVAIMTKNKRGLMLTADPKEIPQDSSKAGMKTTTVAQVNLSTVAMEKEEAKMDLTRPGTMAIKMMKMVMRTGAVEPKVRKVNSMRHIAIETVTDTEQANT